MVSDIQAGDGNVANLFLRCARQDHRVHTEWQRPLSGLHSMMEKLAQASEGGGARPPPFSIFTITCKVAVSALDERADILPLFHLYLYVLCGQDSVGCHWGPGECEECIVKFHNHTLVKKHL